MKTVRSTTRSSAENPCPSFHVPLNGGVPVRLTVMMPLSQSLVVSASFAVGGATQPRDESTLTCAAAVAVQLSAATVTWMSTGAPPVGTMETESPLAVDGVPFAIVHDAVVPGASLTRAVNGMPTPVAAGASMLTTRTLLQLDAAAVPRPAARVRAATAVVVVDACRTTLLSP